MTVVYSLCLSLVVNDDDPVRTSSHTIYMSLTNPGSDSAWDSHPTRSPQQKVSLNKKYLGTNFVLYFVF